MKKLSNLFIFLLGLTIVFAQDGLPENPEPGKCYAKCVAPDEYREEKVQVLL